MPLIQVKLIEGVFDVAEKAAVIEKLTDAAHHRRRGVRQRHQTFVAVVVLQLAEEGRLDLDAGIDGFLPDLPRADRITPRQLLQHASGLGEYLDQPALLTDAQRGVGAVRADRRRRGGRTSG